METLLKAQAETPRRFWWHWQNLNDRKDGSRGSGIRHGRCWWHFHLGKVNWGSYRTIQFSWNLLTHFCGISLDIDDEDVTLMLALPPVAFWFSLSTNWGWLNHILPRKSLEYYPDTIVIDERECGIKIHSGRLWVNPWSKRMETRSADPWWVRGISFQLNPFEWRHQAHEVWRESKGDWVPFVGSWEIGPPCAFNQFQVKESEQRTEWKLPYRYILKNGTVQDVIATVHVERWSSRPLCLRWTKLFERTRRSIAVSFSEEVGEKSGSWKGGCTGCGYEILPRETAEQCLRRMERERKF